MNTHPAFKLIMLWILIIIGMILHFNYHVSEIFYGVNVAKPGTNGVVPAGAHMIKNIFYHIPLLLVISLLYFTNKWYKLFLFVTSLLFTAAHVQHLAGEFKHDTYDLSQIPLLVIVLLVSLLINKASWDYYKKTVTA